MISRPQTIIVFGATSYLGQFLLTALLARGDRVYAVVRKPQIADILLHQFKGGVMIVRSEEMPRESADAVIDLAYVKQPAPIGLFRRNRGLLEAVHRTAIRVQSPLLVHVSSAAVFGYHLHSPPAPGPAPHVHGDWYVELKADAERRVLALAARADYLPVIVRPGNILGPSSPAWLAVPAQRMIEGRPVALTGIDGFSNATYAQNLADYLAHLTKVSVALLATFGVYHHVAEFSAVRWSVFLRAFARTIGVDPVYVRGPLSTGSQPLLPRLAARVISAYRGSLGVWLRRSLGDLPFEELGDRLYLRLKSQLASGSLIKDKYIGPADVHYLTIVSAEHEFRCHVLESWRAPVGVEVALSEMCSGLESDGYALDGLHGSPLAMV